MAGVDEPRAQRETGSGADSRNPPALASLISAVGAIAVFLVARHVPLSGIHLVAIAVPALGVLATVLGIVGLRRARQSGTDRLAAQWGLGLGICILIMALLFGVYALLLSGLSDNAF
jgi:drug/metabolite transporter (DMT)-like permease